MPLQKDVMSKMSLSCILDELWAHNIFNLFLIVYMVLKFNSRFQVSPFEYTQAGFDSA